MRRYFSGLDIAVDYDAFDANNDTIVNNIDGSIIYRDSYENIDLVS